MPIFSFLKLLCEDKIMLRSAILVFVSIFTGWVFHSTINILAINALPKKEVYQEVLNKQLLQLLMLLHS